MRKNGPGLVTYEAGVTSCFERLLVSTVATGDKRTK